MAENRELQAEWLRYVELMEERPELFVNNGEIHIVKDERVIADYQEKNNRKIGVVYESAYNIMVVDLVYEEEGKYFAYERLLPAVKGGAVVVLPIYNGKMILLKQYRHALRDYQYAVPRGFGEMGLSAEENCKKEVKEEIGAEVKTLECLGEIAPDSGLLSNKVSIYACELVDYDNKVKSEGICEILEVEISVFESMIKAGRVTDGFTLAAWSLYKSKI